MTDTRPTWADRAGYTVYVPPGHVALIVPLPVDDTLEEDG